MSPCVPIGTDVCPHSRGWARGQLVLSKLNRAGKCREPNSPNPASATPGRSCASHRRPWGTGSSVLQSCGEHLAFASTTGHPSPGSLAHPPGFLAFRRVWQRDAVSEMTRRKNEGFFRTCWLNGSWSTQAWNLRKVRFLRGKSRGCNVCVSRCVCLQGPVCTWPIPWAPSKQRACVHQPAM